MAEFCKQCADDMGFPESDFVNPDLKHGLYNTVLCEGCGWTNVNSKGECVSTDCLQEGHSVKPDYGVRYYTHSISFDFGGRKVKEIDYGEWSHTIEHYHMIESIDQIDGNIGDIVYVCSEGVYTAWEFI